MSRTQDSVDTALDCTSSEMGPEAARQVTSMKCDMGNWREVSKTAKKIMSNTDRMDNLINNVVRRITTYQLTDYGVDRHMAVNHMGLSKRVELEPRAEWTIRTKQIGRDAARLAKHLTQSSHPNVLASSVHPSFVHMKMS
jgi:NAD(P)-dependent dehydrogenase (short-subunit alcohol dehydrogenase family)